MPQATEELRHRMRDMFGSESADSEPWSYLKDRGFFQNPSGVIRPPRDGYQLSQDESDCIDYLFQEWDYAYDPSEAIPDFLRRT